MEIVVDAIYDYRYLLTRGYPIEHALNIVSLKYSLDKKQKLFLYRCVHSKQHAYETKSKIVRDSSEIEGIVMDFYNILLTSIEVFMKKEVFLCDDCLIRDLRGSKIHADEVPFISTIFSRIANAIKLIGFKKVIVVADKNISYSMEYLRLFTEIMNSYGINCYGILSKTTDKDVIAISSENRNIAVATTDIVIIRNALRIYPLINCMISIYRDEYRIFDVSTILGEDCSSYIDKKCIDAIDK
ncbi:protein of unknown function DUF434 [Ignisphaera aggregans DSM 17230]|uniref:DUF434 domain-containing protein n=1 Tax=Ignisphaera aggregans (strain DSM 17230 / JCM 13409 / AQ1.S1) TaxID=583356 RepID=E0SR08_IGNAA|nr:protein of unknown function DUF434 [Ignisphaera aggregans DSM 17230]